MTTLKFRNPTTGLWEVLETGIGPPGPQGPVGPSGGSYRHVQMIPATVWMIVHPLGYQPNVTVVNSSGEQVEGEVDFVSETTVTVTFVSAITGDAYLS